VGAGCRSYATNEVTVGWLSCFIKHRSSYLCISASVSWDDWCWIVTVRSDDIENVSLAPLLGLLIFKALIDRDANHAIGPVLSDLWTAFGKHFHLLFVKGVIQCVPKGGCTQRCHISLKAFPRLYDHDSCVCKWD